MIIVMEKHATKEQISAVIDWVSAHGLDTDVSEGEELTIIGVKGDERTLDRGQVESLEGVEKTMPVLPPYKKASIDMHPEPTMIALNGMRVGSAAGNKLVMIAGPCSAESREQVLETAHAVKEAGATAFRGGAYKPRSSPYSFQGHGVDALEWMAEAREKYDLPVVTECMSVDTLPIVDDLADVIQIGARNMQNYALLKALGGAKNPVLLKRGMSATMEELLMSAEYILANGNPNVMLCERGIRTFEKYTRNTFDLNAIPALKERTHLPIIADPSHATGHWEYVESVTLGAIAAGADGTIIEVHPNPSEALSDGQQSLLPERYEALMEKARQVAAAIGRSI